MKNVGKKFKLDGMAWNLFTFEIQLVADVKIINYEQIIKFNIAMLFYLIIQLLNVAEKTSSVNNEEQKVNDIFGK